MFWLFHYSIPNKCFCVSIFREMLYYLVEIPLETVLYIPDKEEPPQMCLYNRDLVPVGLRKKTLYVLDSHK